MNETERDWPPVVHPTDPATSHAAAAKFTIGGGRRTQAERILAEIRQHPGLIVDEIAVNVGLHTMKVRKRATDLKNLGLVYQSGTHKGDDGYAQGRWWPEAKELQLSLGVLP